MGLFNKGGGRDDAAFEMSRDCPLIKLAAIVIGVILVLAVLGVFLLRVTRIEAGHVRVEINLELGFNSKQGMGIFVDVYAIEAAKAPDFYVKYRLADMESFTHGFCATWRATR